MAQWSGVSLRQVKAQQAAVGKSRALPLSGNLVCPRNQDHLGYVGIDLRVVARHGGNLYVMLRYNGMQGRRYDPY